MTQEIKFTGERYVPTEKGQIEAEHLHRYLLAKELTKNKIVLDIASGEGYGSALISEYAKKVIGVDIDKEVVSHANNKYSSDNLEYKHGSCASIPVDDSSIDIVVSFETIEHHEQHDEMMREINRVLKLDGVLLISSPNKHEYSDVNNYVNPYHVKELYKEELESLLKKHFKNISLLGQRMIYGSTIINEKNSTGLNFLSKDSNDIGSSAKLTHPQYDVVIASNERLPKLQNSFFERPVEDNNVVIILRELLLDRDEQVESLNQNLTERNEQVESLNQNLTERNEQVESLNQNLTERNEQIAALLQTLTELKNSRSWRITRPMRYTGNTLKSLIKITLKMTHKFSDPIVTRKKLYNWYWELKRCPLFDRKWYLEHNPDVSDANINPIWHYITNGWKENRRPGPEFSNEYYLASNPDIANLDQPLILHYWLHGRYEGRHYNPTLDLEWLEGEPHATRQSLQIHSEDEQQISQVIKQPQDAVIISVIIPTYNRIKFLPGILESWRKVHLSTSFNYEIIFSDDGSSDGSVEYLETVNDLPLKILRNVHGGASSARNAAIHAACGERLLIIGDDIFPDQEILNIHARLSQQMGPKVAILGTVDWHDDLDVNHLMHHITEIGNEQFSYNRLKDNSFTDFRHFYTCNISVDRAFLLEEDVIFDERFNTAAFEDIELGYRLALRGMRLFYTTEASGGHFHPYTTVGFCRRQAATGRMAVVFRNIHPGVETLLGIDALSSRVSKDSKRSGKDILWQNRLDRLARRCDEYEKLVVMLPKDKSAGIRQCLSSVYSRLFKAMYEYGILSQLNEHTNTLAIAMSYYFENTLTQYWTLLDKNIENAINLKTDESFNLNEALLTGDKGDLLYGAEQIIVFDELIQLKSLNQERHMTANNYNKLSYLCSRAVYYLINDPRHTIYRAKQAFSRFYSRKPAIQAQTTNLSTGVTALLALIIEPHEQQRDEMISLFRAAFGEEALVYEKKDDNLLIPQLKNGRYGKPISSSFAKATIFFWPSSIKAMPHKDLLLSAYMALVENELSLALISHSLELGQTVSVGNLRNHLLFSRDIAENIFNNTLVNLAFRGKVLRLLPASDAAHEKNLDEVIGAPVYVDDNGFFTSSSKNTIATIHYRQPYLPPYSKTKPIVFVFPIFLAVGGVERNTIEIMRQLRDRFDFVVVTMERLRPDQGSLAAQAIDVADVIDMAEIICHKDYLRLLARLKTNMQPNLIWVCNGSPWFVDNAKEIRQIFHDVPIVDQEVYDTKEGWINRYAEEGIQSFDHFIAINKKIEERFLNHFGINSERIHMIYPVFDALRIRKTKNSLPNKTILKSKFSLPENKKIFVFVGRLSQQKRPIEFLKLVKSRSKFSDEYFVMLGDGELAPEVDAFINNNSLCNVKRISYIENVPEFFAVCSGIIFTSVFEGLPIAMLEALSMGVPVLSTDVGDVAIVLEEYGGGFVTKNTYSTEYFYESFETWLTHRDDYIMNLKTHEKEILDYFSSEKIAEQYADCWRIAINQYKR
jgi:glycosyltransferase involved in cell wall biosynthesis/ubiquinone/menaquinone biosynthesis C-methylase UbiE/GT2 family glycosyltransferase